MPLLPALERFLDHTAHVTSGDRLVVAFSGGPDSTALLWGLCQLAPRYGFEVSAAHLDHGLDPGSAARAAAARDLATALGAPIVVERRDVAGLRRAGESPEAAARRVRYGFLEEVRERRRARWIATAHHRDDQAETVVLRLLFGSGLAGLAGIRPVHGAVLRPLLDLGRAELAAAVAAAGLAPLADPTNSDLTVPRNRIRHLLLPVLADTAGLAEHELAERLAGLAARARGATIRLDGSLDRRLDPAAGPGLSPARLAALPEPLALWALAAAERRAGAPYPASLGARRELLRQVAGLAGAVDRQAAGGGRLGCDCGGGWRWEGDGRRLAPVRPRATAESFSYTLEVPGEVDIPEIAARLRLTQTPIAPWMFHGEAWRAALAARDLAPGGRVTVRSRRPGDRLVPLGAPGGRRLKDVLIDRQVPRDERDRLPLLCVDGHIAWVPGVTIDERFRLPRKGAGATVWVAEVTVQP
jgi:tRNA(Ile)-lysidine synthase